MIKQFVKKLIQYYIDLIVSWYRKIKTYYNLNSEIKKIIGELHKASRTHKGQAERLEKILKVIQNVDKKKTG